MIRVLILGGDGYLGWPTAMFLSRNGYDVAVVDNYFRRKACHELDAEPLIPVPNLKQRVNFWKEKSGIEIKCACGDIRNYDFLSKCFTGEIFSNREISNSSNNKFWTPDAVVHYAEQPSAPYSMMDREKALFTLTNNLEGTANLIHAVKDFNPACHIVKLGTMGVYGTPNIDIEEGFIEVEHKGRKHTFLYPKTPGSLYHLTKAQDGDMLYFYVRIWDLRVTDLNQGPVYGIRTNESGNDDRLASIFNYDAVFGTVLNRFVVQAVCGFPLTVYGKGGQARGYLNIKDTLACVELALRFPAKKSQYRVFNQFVETFTVNQLAEKVRETSEQMGLSVKIKSIANPRKELEEHYYNPTHQGLMELGLKPHFLTDEFLSEMIGTVLRYKENIQQGYLLPKVSW